MCVCQGCGLGRDVSVSRWSQDVLTFRSHLDLGLGVSGHCVLSRRFAQARAVHTAAAVRAILTSMTFVA